MRKQLLVALVLLGLGCSSSQPEDLQPATNDSDKVAPKDTTKDELGDLVTFAGYSLRPPAGYTKFKPNNAPAGMKIAAWKGEQRANGTSAMIQVMVVRPPAGEELPSARTAFSKMVGAIKNRRSRWQQTPTEVTEIGGITFQSTRWSGHDANRNVKMHGVLMVAVDDGKVIQLFTQDVEPHHESALALGVASLKTFSLKD